MKQGEPHAQLCFVTARHLGGRLRGVRAATWNTRSELEAEELTLAQLRRRRATLARRIASGRFETVAWLSERSRSTTSAASNGGWPPGTHCGAKQPWCSGCLYGLYELARGLVVSNAREADHHAHDVVALERWLHEFPEPNVQHATRNLPGLTSLLGTAYLTLHLAVTAGVLLWLHSRRPAAFPFVRSALLIASALALVGFLAYPTAPPRLAGIGIADTVSNGHVDLNKGLVSSLYNPYAAIPSMHIGYALIVAASLLLYARRPLVRVLGALYPPFVLPSWSPPATTSSSTPPPVPWLRPPPQRPSF